MLGQAVPQHEILGRQREGGGGGGAIDEIRVIVQVRNHFS
jgi:hypothetical protein